MAEALGSRRAALLRNHGVVIAGEDVRWAVLAAVTLERAIRFQAIAATLGQPRPIPQAGAERLGPQKYQECLPRRVLGRLGPPGPRPRRRGARGGALR